MQRRIKWAYEYGNKHVMQTKLVKWHKNVPINN